MVSVCAGCDGYYPWAAAFVSAVSGALYFVVSKLVISLKLTILLMLWQFMLALGCGTLLQLQYSWTQVNILYQNYTDKLLKVFSTLGPNLL